MQCSKLQLSRYAMAGAIDMGAGDSHITRNDHDHQSTAMNIAHQYHPVVNQSVSCHNLTLPSLHQQRC